MSRPLHFKDALAKWRVEALAGAAMAPGVIAGVAAAWGAIGDGADPAHGVIIGGAVGTVGVVAGVQLVEFVVLMVDRHRVRAGADAETASGLVSPSG